MTHKKATKVAEKFNDLYFRDYLDTTTFNVKPAVVEVDSEGDFDVIISANDGVFSYSAMRSAMKVCSMYHLMLFVYNGLNGLQIHIHS